MTRHVFRNTNTRQVSVPMWPAKANTSHRATVPAEFTKGKYYPKKYYPKKDKPKIEVVLVIVVSPQFLGPKTLTICSTAGLCFFFSVLLSWMGMLFQRWWWMRTGRGLLCQLPGTIGEMSTSTQLLIGQGNVL